MIIPTKELSEKHRGRHFQIWYDLNSQTYKVKDLGIGCGVFLRLNLALDLKDNHLLSMGETFVVVNLVKDSMVEGHEIPKLRLKIIRGPSTG